MPIVPAAVVFNPAVGGPISPKPNHARAAILAAVEPSLTEVGRVGAGTEAATNKLVGLPRPGGVGIGSRAESDVAVWLIAVVDAAGSADEVDPRSQLLEASPDLGDRSSTVLVAVAILGPADERTRRRCAVAAHAGMARVVVPCDTI